jgi:hypothetical protein
MPPKKNPAKNQKCPETGLTILDSQWEEFHVNWSSKHRLLYRPDTPGGITDAEAALEEVDYLDKFWLKVSNVDNAMPILLTSA